MADEEVIDLVKYASENKPVDFTNAIDAIMGKKAIEMLSIAKQAVASNMFNDSEEQDTDEEESESDDEESIETEEETEEETGETDD